MSTVAAATRGIEVFARLFDSAPQLAGYTDRARRMLAVTAALFAQRGAVDTSIRDITRACGQTPGAFYRHFASKDDALFVLVNLGHERMEDRLEQALRRGDTDARSRLRAFVGAYVTAHLEQPEFAQLVRREYLHLSPARRDTVVRRRRVLRSRLVDLLAEGTAAGVLHPPGGPDDRTRVAVMLLDMCSRTAEWYHPDREQPPTQLCELYVEGALRLAGAG